MRVTEVRIYSINEDLERGIAEYFNTACLLSMIVAKDPDPVRI